jgi:hypothetical protein
MQTILDQQEIDEVTKSLNALLRGELAATETYQQAMEVLGHAPGAMDLKRIHDEHREAANTLRLQIRDIGGIPDDSSEAWGSWAGLVEGAAGTLGPRLAAQALKQGEEFGVKEYEEALQDEHVPNDIKMLIHCCFLPHTREHVATLDRIIDVL